MAALCNAGGPESAFIDFTWPDASTSASNVTFSALPAPKSCRAFGEAIAFTDLINFGGTMAAPSAGGTVDTIAALFNGGVAERLLAETAITGFSGTAAAASGDGLPAPSVSGA